MVGAFSIGAVGAIVGGAASSIAEVASGGIEIARGIVDVASRASRAAFPPDDDNNNAINTSQEQGSDEIKEEENDTRESFTDITERRNDDDEEFSDEQRPSWSRGCFKIASGAVLVPVASCSIAAMFAVGAACGSIALAGGVLKEIGSSLVSAARLTANAISGNHSSSDDNQATTENTTDLTTIPASSGI
uniref:Uncharacterized protein n=1 Tax=Aureoumbra lagunensis TaxID=44058 RepID=A0A7S3JS34_9STRA|mmetsp:Transcript_15/g.24  ORF Transcript_15/g.24 Transcript_15/m.24 type:complete len:190 (-) Transcript_15:475-1044(-)